MDQRKNKNDTPNRVRWEKPVIKSILPAKRTQGGFFTFVEDTDTRNVS